MFSIIPSFFFLIRTKGARVNLYDADVTVYENAMVAAAEGLAAMNSEIDAQYDKEYP